MTFFADGIWEYLQNKINEFILDTVSMILQWAIGVSSYFYDVPVISGLIDLSQYVSYLVLAAAVIVMIFDVFEDKTAGKAVYTTTIISNYFKAFMFATAVPIATKYSMNVVDLALVQINVVVGAELNAFTIIGDLISATTAGASNTFLLVILLIALFAFTFMSLNRFGAILVQILTCCLYVPSIVRGDTTALGSWLRQTTAILLTFFFQYLLFYLGLSMWLANEIPLACGCWLTMLNVSKLLDKYGWSTGTGGMMSSAGSMAMQGVQLLAH